MLLDPTGPLSLRLSPHLPTMLPWASLFGLHCRPKAVEHTAKALGQLLSRAEQGDEPQNPRSVNALGQLLSRAVQAPNPKP
jgi:hypothetical protein